MPALLYHAGALGDFITTIPAIRFWKKRHRDEGLVMLGGRATGEFAKDIGLVDDALDVDAARFLPLFLEGNSDEAERLLAPFTAAIIFSHPDSPLVGHVRRTARISLSCQPPFPAPGQHVVDYHLSLFADPAAIADREKIPHIVPSAEAMSAAGKIIPFDKKTVALHPGSGSTKKNWPFERFVDLARALRNRGVPVLWLHGPADDPFAAPSGDLLVSPPSLSHCAALLSQCRACIGNDSGISHLSAAAGCPTVAIFGPSDPVVWAPRGRNVQVMCTGLSCSPCHHTPRGDAQCARACLLKITVEEVLAKIPRCAGVGA